eukprot:TRINITY_DN72930_c0_g1_i1.p1 TRINITY_DN72930_c0_g1~~TRINITY_DN72930_c0_g1_i1.p1  ORF type:complete len:261 (+),score=17.16 TRINITY_DN72930_c0_g1_i1:96-878(+)
MNKAIRRKYNRESKLWSGTSAKLIGIVLIFVVLTCIVVLLNIRTLENAFATTVGASDEGTDSGTRYSIEERNTLIHTLESGFPQLGDRVRVGQLSVSLRAQKQTLLDLESFRWKKWQFNLAAAQLLSLSLEISRGSDHIKASCVLSGQFGLDIWIPIECEGLEGQIRINLYEFGLEGAALRWRLRSAHPDINAAHIGSWLPGVQVEGSVDGSPIVARRRPKWSTISLGCKVKASGSSEGRGPERTVDGDAEREWFAATGD